MRTPNHLNALRTFEAAARHLSYVAAGDELGVTPAAVSQLVRGLEETLGVKLFRRSRSGPARLELTDLAQSAIPDLQAGFYHLAVVIERLRTGSASAAIRVAVPSAFADKWLLPRVQRFRHDHPDYDLHIGTNCRFGELAAGRLDICVWFGAEPSPGFQSTLLLREGCFPVCNPNQVAGYRPPRCADELNRFPLIHDVSAAARGTSLTWRAWLQRAGIGGIDTGRGLHLDDPGAAIQAAVAGCGVALARSALVRAELEERRLFRPFGARLGSELGYYALRRREDADREPVALFHDWLIAEARRDREA
ncbi:transcriptional regulator, LysR family [Methylobacterium sp. 4-46]|uniref:LysR substrate-binding domain-containing protein n=1 Tax=unclassified Methylobacterium TaxID=2615210 RepID=UPI000165C62F|nr:MULTISPECIES: LysR substrate-binding domain-containing protein [Methylobacterium]ACA15882.1 transcriptional regulator, LysR family [Methylobacterium sp. 4-46]WFT81605.1 LysR substrate-binding domain-containing protein [Methylobacterium nodulans]